MYTNDTEEGGRGITAVNKYTIFFRLYRISDKIDGEIGVAFTPSRIHKFIHAGEAIFVVVFYVWFIWPSSDHNNHMIYIFILKTCVSRLKCTHVWCSRITMEKRSFHIVLYPGWWRWWCVVVKVFSYQFVHHLIN